MGILTKVDFSSSFVYSIMGLTVVMTVLAILAISIILLSKIAMTRSVDAMHSVTKKETQISNATTQQNIQSADQIKETLTDDLNEEIFAVLLAAVSDACGLPIGSFEITSIREVL